MNGFSVDYFTAQAAGLNLTYGVLVQSVTSNGPADQGGMKGGTYSVSVAGTQITAGGDLIIQIGPQRVPTLEDMISYMDLNTTPGQIINFTVVRGNSTLILPITLGMRP